MARPPSAFRYGPPRLGASSTQSVPGRCAASLDTRQHQPWRRPRHPKLAPSPSGRRAPAAEGAEVGSICCLYARSGGMHGNPGTGLVSRPPAVAAQRVPFLGPSRRQAEPPCQSWAAALPDIRPPSRTAGRPASPKRCGDVAAPPAALPRCQGVAEAGESAACAPGARDAGAAAPPPRPRHQIPANGPVRSRVQARLPPVVTAPEEPVAAGAHRCRPDGLRGRHPRPPAGKGPAAARRGSLAPPLPGRRTVRTVTSATVAAASLRFRSINPQNPHAAAQAAIQHELPALPSQTGTLHPSGPCPRLEAPPPGRRRRVNSGVRTHGRPAPS